MGASFLIEAVKHLDSQDRGSPLLPLLYTLNWLPASPLLLPRSGLERSDFVLWPIASFRGDAEFGRYRGIADVDVRPPACNHGGGHPLKPSSLKSRAWISAPVSRD